jgi:anti-anti-sigma factor
MHFDIRRVRDELVVELDGDADLGAAPLLSQALQRGVTQASGAASTLVIDLDGLLVLDDTALGLLVGAAASARRAGLDVALLCTDERMRARLADTRVDRIIDVRSGTA